LLRKAAPHVARATPHLVRGLSQVARTLRRNPRTRPLVRTLPTIASRTTHSLARGAAHGHPITRRQAVRTLARQTKAVLARPHTRQQVIHRARALDRSYHRGVRNGQWWTGATPSRTTTRARAHRPIAPGGFAPVSYQTPVRYRRPARYGSRVRYGAPVSGATARQVHGYDYPRGYGYPRGDGYPRGEGCPRGGGYPRGEGYPRVTGYPRRLSTAWIPVKAWCGSEPPHARRY
jgi:hypothetical protein